MLGDLCEHHHTLKHSAALSISVRTDGTIDLTLPGVPTRHIPYPRLHDGPLDESQLDYEPPPKPSAPQSEPLLHPDVEPPS